MIWLVFCDCGFHSSVLWWIRIRGLWKFPFGRNWGKLGLVLMGETMLSKSLIQFSVDGQGCVPCLMFDLIPNYGEGNKANGNFLQKVPCTHCHTQCSSPAACHNWPTPPPETPGHSQANLGQSLVGSLLLSCESWCTQSFVCTLQESVSLFLCRFCNQIPLASKVRFPGDSQSHCQIPWLGNLVRVLEFS